MSAGAAAGAAAAMARRIREEEESMTGYTPGDLSEGWEFKFLRSATGSFRKPECLRQAVEEEGRAGWVLLEKFDNKRLRFKRPTSARSGDAALAPGFDPYRTSYGMGEWTLFALIMTSVFTTIGLAILIIVLSVPK